MSVRSFFAVELNAKPIINKIIAFQNKLIETGGRIKLVAPENIHLTMKFLGDIDEKILPDLQKETETISFEKFLVEYRGTGCLPNLQRINTIYIDVKKGKEKLTELAKEIEEICSKFNLRKETRAYKAHLTIGRVKYPGDKQLLIERIKEQQEELFGEVEVTSFQLKKSILTPTGPKYSDLFRINLK